MQGGPPVEPRADSTLDSFFLKQFFSPSRNCPASHPGPPCQGCPRAGAQPQLFREVPARLFHSPRGAAPVWKPHREP